MNQFRGNRQLFFSKIKDFWHDIYDNEYALFDIKKESYETVHRIHQATEQIGHIFYKTASLLRKVDDETFLRLGFPAETHSFIRLQTLPVESVIARLDLVMTDGHIKVLELNADTPTFIKETFYVNGKVCEKFGLENPNEGCEDQLRQAVLQAIMMSLRSTKDASNIVFAAHSEHEEDKWTTMYLKELIGLRSQYMDFNELQLIDKPIVENEEVVLSQGLYDKYGEKIDVLYRQTYPIEHLLNDEDPITKERVGQMLMKLIEQQDVAVVNPPSAFLLQSKAIMALIWGLHEERHSFYMPEEHNAIDNYFLPTYLDPDVFLQQGQSFVKKPAFGREGDTIEIFSHTGKKIEEDIQKTYLDELPVYQQFIELPVTTIQTEQGPKRVHYMYGSFYINGKASAIGIRAGGQITDNSSYFLPLGYSERSKTDESEA